MENKEHLSPDAGNNTGQPEERLNPHGSPLNDTKDGNSTKAAELKPADGPLQKTEPEAEPETAAPEPAPEAAPEVIPEPTSESEPEPLKEAEPVVEPIAEKETEPVAKPVAEKETEPVVEPIAETETEPVTEPDADKETEPVAKPVAEKETEPVTEPDAEKETEPVAKPIAETETEPVTEPDADKETEPEKDSAEKISPAKKKTSSKTLKTEHETDDLSQAADIASGPADQDASQVDVKEKPDMEEPEALDTGAKEGEIAEKPAAETAGEVEEDLAERYAGMTRPELVEVVEALIKEEDVNLIRTHIGFIKAAFRKLLKEESIADFEKRLLEEGEQEDGPAELPADPLTERFDQAFEVYREKKALYDQALEQQKQENLAVKEGILEELRSLIESEEELKKTYDIFRDLQEKWRNVGAVPQNSKGTLWNNYHFLVEKFFDKVKINKELKDLDLKRNLEAKTELCEKAEELLLETSITKSFQRLQKLHEAWKETGPVPKDKKDEIWDRFKAATDKLNKRRQEYYDVLRDEQNNNYTAKIVLCEKAELIAATTPVSPKQWQQQTNEINELFKMWKTIGFAPKKVNNEIWNRFRSALDSFYRSKKEFFKKYKEVQTENYNQKLNLCLQAEALKENEDWKATTEELISLQKEWKKIGPVPAKFSDKIWKRFRAACDEFFNKKSDHFSNIGEKQDENLKKKLDLIEQVKNHAYSDDNARNLDTLKEFQRKWMNIGHVPIKQKDRLQNEFRKTIDHQFEVLNISKKAKSTLSFRSKVEHIRNSPQGDNILYKERNFLANKINAIQSDIKIWENNIGFFASSKKADILKAEFEEKIEKGKQEIALLEEKLKILRES
jgi:hypothetical protein